MQQAADHERLTCPLAALVKFRLYSSVIFVCSCIAAGSRCHGYSEIAICHFLLYKQRVIATLEITQWQYVIIIMVSKNVRKFLALAHPDDSGDAHLWVQ